MKKNTLTKEKIVSLIKEEAEVIKQKKEIHNQIVKLNEELKVLYEERGLTGTFGFKSDTDGINKSKTGFKETPNISFIAQLEKEIGKEQDEEAPIDKALDEKEGEEKPEVDEMEALKKENEELKNKIKNIEETLKSSPITE